MESRAQWARSIADLQRQRQNKRDSKRDRQTDRHGDRDRKIEKNETVRDGHRDRKIEKIRQRETDRKLTQVRS